MLLSAETGGNDAHESLFGLSMLSSGIYATVLSFSIWWAAALALFTSAAWRAFELNA